jgi:hypothetical protein
MPAAFVKEMRPLRRLVAVIMYACFLLEAVHEPHPSCLPNYLDKTCWWDQIMMRVSSWVLQSVSYSYPFGFVAGK